MIAASEGGRARAAQCARFSSRSDGLGHGYVTERVAGETLGHADRARRAVRGCARGRWRRNAARSSRRFIASTGASAVPDVRTRRRTSRRIARSSIITACDCRRWSMGLRWAAENVPKNARHTVVHGDFRARQSDRRRRRRALRARLGTRTERRSDAGPGLAMRQDVAFRRAGAGGRLRHARGSCMPPTKERADSRLIRRTCVSGRRSATSSGRSIACAWARAGSRRSVSSGVRSGGGSKSRCGISSI